MSYFRVRARAVDLLGRQQIAGIPTAVHELFKNAHDAYAEQVEVDYFREERLLVLRDDGLGMTREDIEDKWLTLGTESRVGANDPTTAVWTGPKHLPRRIITGEKGIGRLSVAAIAPVTLLVSKAIRPDGPRNTLCALVHWSLFELPGVDVSSIHIPIRELGQELPGKSTLKEMIDETRLSITNSFSNFPRSETLRLLEEIGSLSSLDLQHLDNFLNGDRQNPLSINKDSFGTWFIASPTALEINADIDHFPESMGTSNFNKVLLGFANTMDKHYSPIIQTAFRDHRTDGVYDLIGPRQFFSSEDFDHLDHIIEGLFDELGQFRGTISFFGGTAKPFVLNWSEGRGRPTRCGPFELRLGAIQGRPNETRLDRTTHAAMLSRLNELGGLYFYRDGIRVLPYGTAHNDFLGIELRRTLAAKDWYFSHRRMIAYVALSSNSNPNLREKAGREGFRENYAYRDLRSVLEGFFKAVAVRFFRVTSDEGADYQEIKETFVRENEALQRRARRVNERRKHFRSRMEAFRKAIDHDEYEARTQALIDEYSRRLDDIEEEANDQTARALLEAVTTCLRHEIASLHGDIIVSLPRGLALTKSLERDWEAYKRLLPTILDQTVGSAETALLPRLDGLKRRRGAEGRVKEQALEALARRKAQYYKEVALRQREARGVAEKASVTLRQTLTKDLRRLHDEFEIVEQEYAESLQTRTPDVEQSWNDVERRLRAIKERELEFVASVHRQFMEADKGMASGSTVDDEVAALERRVERLTEQVEFQADLAQVGMAVGILGHEFNHTVSEFRDSIHALRPWVEGTPSLLGLYRRLRSSFEGLEDYLQMLTPLGRRLRRRRVELSGAEIELYIRRVFAERIKDSEVVIKSTPRFGDHMAKCRNASLLGAFVNLIDNALYWLVVGREKPRLITLDADCDAFLVGNNGPGISELDSERIFEFGWTSKPGGAGMGLALSVEALKREGFRLELRQPGVSKEPVFAIVTALEEEEEPNE